MAASRTHPRADGLRSLMPPDGKLHQKTKGLLADVASKANSETLLGEIGSAGGSEFLSLSDGAAKTKEGTNPGDDITSPLGDNRATNLPQSHTSTSCPSTSFSAAFMAVASSW